MAVITYAKIWLMILQMILITQYQCTMAAKVKREPYSVQETNHGFSLGGDDNSFSSWAGTFSGDSSGNHFIKGQGSFGVSSEQLYATHIEGLNTFGGQDSGIESHGSYGIPIGDDSHASSDDKSISELQDAANSKIKALILESTINRKLAEEKVEKMRKSFGYGTFGYPGYQYPIKTGPIDLGTHHAIDLGTTLDGSSIKDSNGKLKLPVQTVYITKTVGVPIPHPFPIKHEVAVPAPYPVPVPSHHSDDSYSNSYSSDYSDDSGKSSYHASESSLSKVVKYHENLPKATEKLYTSASTNFENYAPSLSSSAYSSAFTPNQYGSKQTIYGF